MVNLHNTGSVDFETNLIVSVNFQTIFDAPLNCFWVFMKQTRTSESRSFANVTDTHQVISILLLL